MSDSPDSGSCPATIPADDGGYIRCILPGSHTGDHQANLLGGALIVWWPDPAFHVSVIQQTGTGQWLIKFNHGVPQRPDGDDSDDE